MRGRRAVAASFEPFDPGVSAQVTRDAPIPDVAVAADGSVRIASVTATNGAGITPAGVPSVDLAAASVDPVRPFYGPHYGPRPPGGSA